MKLDGFPANLARIRKERGLSQRDLAKITNISPRMIGYYETHISLPPIKKIEAIAKALATSVDSLIGIDIQNSSINSDIQELTSINPRTIKQLKKILKLSPIDRSTVYKFVDSLLMKKEYTNKQKQTNKI